MKSTSDFFVKAKIQVCHYFDEMPCDPLVVEVENEREANLVVNALKSQTRFLTENDFIENYSGAVVVEMLEDGEWVDYSNNGENFSEFADTFLTSHTA